MKIKILGALLFVTALSAGCAVDDVAEVEESSEEQSLAAGCTLLRPFAWTQSGVPCHENPTTPFPMAHGSTYTAFATGGGIYGYGQATVVCNNGAIQQTSATCRRGVEN